MPRVVSIHSKPQLQKFLEKNPHQFLYLLGDLDDFFWPYTIWYALVDEQDEIHELALLYIAVTPPNLIAKVNQSTEEMQLLLRGIAPFLPSELHAHLSEDVTDALNDHYQLTSYGIFYRMALQDAQKARTVDARRAERLSVEHLDELQHLYQTAYPDNWFDPRMLETGQYFGVRQDAQLVSVAGIHVYAPTYHAGVLGNITTHPDYRGQGLATIAAAGVCQSLLQETHIIGLNVHTENHAALKAYRRLGFEVFSTYGEFTLRASVP